MKKLFTRIIIGAISLAGCQQQKQPVQAMNASLPSADNPTALVMTAPSVAMVDSLTSEMRNMLRQVDISRLFLAPESQTAGFKMALDGFFGTNPQRLSLAILQASRDSIRPEVIHVAGKVRYKKAVTDFTGEIHLTNLVDYYDQGLLLSQGEEGFVQDTVSEEGTVLNARAYAASATFRLVGQAPAAYVLTGHTFLDFWLMTNGKLGIMYTPSQGAILAKAATKGSGLVLQGNWQDVASNTTRTFLVSSNIFLLSPDLIKDFGIGDRSSEVNPKYAKLGWNELWENDEWWVDSGKSSLNL